MTKTSLNVFGAYRALKHRGVTASLATIATVAIVSSMASTADAQRRPSAQWDNLGCVEVERGRDRDVIRVGRREGRYRAIRLEVSGNDVNVENVRVIYGNGMSDELRVRSELREGTQTRALDLQGRERAIDRVEIVSRRGYRGRGRGRARICVTGLQVERRGNFRQQAGRPGGWEPLGCQKVSFGFKRDRDTIPVGRREGRFRAVRFEVTGNDIHMDRFSVIYANGQPDNLTIGRLLREGTDSGPIDLKGRGRAIERIDMVYRPRLNLRGSANVCVSGLQ